MVRPADAPIPLPSPKTARLSDVVEQALISRILDGTYPVDSILPLERELAASLEVGRPTLREALGRLERDGWIATQKGIGNTVLDYRRTGTLNTLRHILSTGSEYAQKLLVQMLEIRTLLMPECARGAVEVNAQRVVGVLAEAPALPDEAEAYAQFDWNVNRQLCLLSPNPLFLLILKGMDPPYEDLSLLYFSVAENRAASRSFYKRLAEASMNQDKDEAARATSKAMRYAMTWFRALSGEQP